MKLRHEIHNVVFRLLRRTENMRGERKADHADLVNRQGQVFVFHVLILSQVGRDGQHFDCFANPFLKRAALSVSFFVKQTISVSGRICIYIIAYFLQQLDQIFFFHVPILSQVGRDGQHLLFLFFPLDTKGNLDATDGQEVKTANPLCLDQLGHVPILQDVVDARKGGERFFFFLFILAFILSYDIIAAAAFAAACNCRANDTT